MERDCLFLLKLNETLISPGPKNNSTKKKKRIKTDMFLIEGKGCQGRDASKPSLFWTDNYETSLQNLALLYM